MRFTSLYYFLALLYFLKLLIKQITQVIDEIIIESETEFFRKNIKTIFNKIKNNISLISSFK